MFHLEKANFNTQIQEILQNKDKIKYLLFAQSENCMDCIGLILKIIKDDNNIQRVIFPKAWHLLDKKEIYTTTLKYIKKKDKIIVLPSRKKETYKLILIKINQEKVYNHIALIINNEEIIHMANNKVKKHKIESIKKLTKEQKLLSIFRIKSI